MVGVALADDERWNQLGVRVQRDERPDIAVRPGLAGVLLLRADEPPNLVNLDLLAGEVPHLFVHDFLAGGPDADAEVHYRVAVDAGYALDAADARAFAQHGDDSDLLIGCQYVCHNLA